MYLINYTINTERWKAYWKSSLERTASSYLGIHFRHYKVQVRSDMLSIIKSKLVNLAFKNRQPLKRWTKGISIMLEKNENAIYVSKLQVILLLEANFNAANKIIFNI